MEFPHPIFATPDFGAGAAFAAFVILVYFFIFIFCGFFIILGFYLSKSPIKESREKGILMMIFFSVTFWGCWMAPSWLFFLSHGSFPGWPDTDKMKKGMAKEEVRSLAGKPQKIQDQGSRELWTYYGDPFGVSKLYIQFDQQGKVDYMFDQ